MENFNVLFAFQLGLFIYFIGSVLRLFIHLLICKENETK